MVVLITIQLLRGLILEHKCRMSCPGGNYVVPGADPCAGGGGGAIQSINGLVGAITVDSSDSTLNVAATSATNITITNPNIISLNGALGIATLTSTDDSITVTNTGDNINLSVAGGGPLILKFSGTTDVNGSYTNLIGPEEGYIMLDTTYVVVVTQTSAPVENSAIILYVSEKNLDSVSITSLKNANTAEPNVSFDAILVATNYQKITVVPASFEFPVLPVVANFVNTGGGDPTNFGFLPTGTNITTPGGPQYINGNFNPIVNLTVTIAANLSAPLTIPQNTINNNTLLLGIYGPGQDEFIAGFSMPSPGALPLPINYGVGIPSSTGSPNFVSATVAIPYSYLASANQLYYGFFLSFPTNPFAQLFVNNVQMQVKLDYFTYT